MTKTEPPMFTLSRAKILSTLKKSEKKGLTKDELSEKTGLSRASIYHHLEILTKHKLIKETPDLKALGRPIYVSLTDKADPAPDSILKLFEKVFPQLFK